MNIILLSGGSGKRLWPLSNEVRSRQFIKLLKRKDGIYESMIQRVCRQIRTVDPKAKITVAASKAQIPALHNQLGDDVNVCVERWQKNTFPVIALASAYLKDVAGVSEDEPVIVCPIDPYVEDEYFRVVRKMADLVGEGKANLALLGIAPMEASEQYGYIIPKDQAVVSEVKTFKEKPDIKTARRYIKNGALWNGGVFAFQLKYVLEKAHEQIGFVDYEDLYDKYAQLESISFDYAVVEKEKNIQVMRYEGVWKDLSTWLSLCGEMTDSVIGNAICDETCDNLSVVNELNVPVLCMGLKNVVVTASSEGILVSDKKKTLNIEPLVDQIGQMIMFAEKSWGNYQVLDVSDGCMTVKATIAAGHRMNYHSHAHRDEVWTIISGSGRTIVDGMEEVVKQGDVITMEAGCKHTIIADTELQVIEVQLGKEIDVHDKRKYELEE